MNKPFKKIIVFVLCISLLMLSSCGSKGPKKGAYLFEALQPDNPLFGQIKETLPSYVDIFPEDSFAGYTVTDPAEVQALVDAFTKIKLGEEVPQPNGITVVATFYWEDGEGGSSGAWAETAANNAAFWDEEGNKIYYQLEDSAEYEALLMGYLINIPQETNYSEFFSYEGLTFYAGDTFGIEDQKAVLDLRFANGSEKNYMSNLTDVKVNGFGLTSGQGVVVSADNESDYSIRLATPVMNAYGIENIADVSFKVELSDVDMETYDAKDLVFTSDEIRINANSPVIPDTEVKVEESDIVYDNNGVKIAAKVVDNDLYSDMYIYVDNSGDKDAAVQCTGFTYNDTESPDMSGAEKLYTVKAAAGGGSFADFPVYNYSYNETTYETKRIDLTSLTANFAVQVGDSSENITLILK